MKKVELLAPAGNFECFLAAVNAGADAVYLGGRLFGARAFADNFSDEEILEAIRTAHFYGRKVYMTVNTLLKEKETDALIPYLRPFYDGGLDGVIVQDLGVFEICRKAFPGLHLHASTQMTITDAWGARLMKEMGASRIVPARELSLAELRSIHDSVDIEIEAFVHGAMCYCYSGQCLFSSMLGGRSGNRGRCAQPCRQPYRITDGRDAGVERELYPLSLKDMCTIRFLPAMIEAGIDSFKIEGRMKKAEYVAGVTAVYKKYRDRFMADPSAPFAVEEGDMELLKSLYIRSEVSEGYYKRHNGREMITPDKPGYAGCDENVLKKIRAEYLDKEPALPVSLKIRLSPGEAAQLEAVYTPEASDSEPDGEACKIRVSVRGGEVQAAVKKPLTETDIAKQLAKTGGSGFFPAHMDIQIEGPVFLPVSALNELRRETLAKLREEVMMAASVSRRGGLYETVTAISPPPAAMRTGKQKELHREERVPGQRGSFHAKVESAGQAAALASMEGLRRLYVPAGIFLSGQADKLRESLQHRSAPGPAPEIYAVLPKIWREKEQALRGRVETLLSEEPLIDGVQAASPGEYRWLVSIGWNGGIALDHSVYIWNTETLEWWKGRADTYCAPLELNGSALAQLSRRDRPLDGTPEQELMAYGWIPMMVTANCVRKTQGRCLAAAGHGKKEGDLLSAKQQSGEIGSRRFLYLRDRYQASFPVLTDCAHCYNVVYNSVPLSLHGCIDDYAGPLRFDFLGESEEEMKRILAFFLDGQRADQVDGAASRRDREAWYPFTTGHYKKGAQ